MNVFCVRDRLSNIKFSSLLSNSKIYIAYERPVIPTPQLSPIQFTIYNLYIPHAYPYIFSFQIKKCEVEKRRRERIEISLEHMKTLVLNAYGKIVSIFGAVLFFIFCNFLCAIWENADIFIVV